MYIFRLLCILSPPNDIYRYHKDEGVMSLELTEEEDDLKDFS